ncbi:MAG: hypothetical protein ABJ327_05145 [Litoreibacter sp.]
MESNLTGVTASHQAVGAIIISHDHRHPDTSPPREFRRPHAREVQKLIKTLNEPDHREEAAGLIRGLVDKIVLTPDATKTRLMVDLEGDLAGILAMSEQKKPADTGISTDMVVLRDLAVIPHRPPECATQGVVGFVGCGSRI